MKDFDFDRTPMTQEEIAQARELRDKRGNWDTEDVIKALTIVSAMMRRQEEALCQIDMAHAEEVH